MAVVDIQKPKNPDDKYVWGFDTDANEWVAVDRQAAEGGVVGNLARAAGRGFEDVMAGLRQATTGQSDPNLAARQAAASAGAPIAEAVGGFAPEAGAAALAGLATGGAGFFPALAAESAAGGAVSAMRPGTFEDRILAGLEGAGLNLAGGAALKGILQGFKIGRGILSATQNRVAAGIEAGVQRVQTSRAAEAAAAGETAPGAGSVGAARTPAGEVGGEIRQQGAAMDIDEATGAAIENPSVQLTQQRAEELGWKPAPGGGTKSGSASRLAEAAHELMPGRETREQIRAFDNRRLLGQHAAKTIGIEDWQSRDVISGQDLADVEAQLGNAYERIDRETPGISGKTFVRAISGALKEGGFLDPGRIQGQLEKAMERAGQPGAKMSGEQTVETLRQLKSMAAEASARGDSHGAEAALRAQTALQTMVEQIAKRQGKEDLLVRLHKANQSWRVAQMIEAPGVLNPQGEINPLALRNQMKRKRIRGGYGPGGPDPGTPERDLWNLVVTAAREQTGVPMTGARALIYGGGRSVVQGGLAGLGLGGIARASGLWD